MAQNNAMWTGLTLELKLHLAADYDEWRRQVNAAANPWMKDG